MSLEPIPDRVSIDPDSPFYWKHYTTLRVYLDDKLRPSDVIEFCISEGWIRIHAKDSRGRVKRERGKYVPITLKGRVLVNKKELKDSKQYLSVPLTTKE